VKQILDFLNRNHYCTSTIKADQRCYNSLEAFLIQEKTIYSTDVADEWFETAKNTLSKNYQSIYRTALRRLRDIYEFGEVMPEDNTRHSMSYNALNDELRNELDEFLLELKKNLALNTAEHYKQTCARFLIFMQKCGILQVSDMSYDLMCRFYKEDIHYGKWGKHHVNGNVSTMMRFFYNKCKVPYGFTLLFHYLALEKGCYWNDVSKSAHKKIVTIMDSVNTVSVEELREYKEILNKHHSDNEYSKAVRAVNSRAVELLLLFLDMNRYRYNPRIAMIWFDESSHYFNKEASSIHRALCLIAHYHTTAEIRLETVFRTKPCAFDLIPQWSREAACKYVETKTREGWKRSTLDMIRVSICRFCNYLNQIGIRSFMDVNVSHIKQFNIHDIHKTPAGKNAYNVRIRKFLLYLGEKGYLANPMLFISLACTSAPQETIVVVLTESEMDQLNEELNREDSCLSLRKKAMLLLGLKMGLRSSDIVKLTFNDIDWDTASIRFIQDKTEVEISLPMPTEVGNALFRYIMEERHKKHTPNIFLSEKAPHKPVGKAVCGLALDTALPNRNVEGSGFHVTRKTYATNLLRNGVGASTVADALGQRGTTSVHRYLSLDTDRMRMCALSLGECELGGWENGR